MIYLFTALYCEARPFLSYYHLKKETEQTRFQIFSSEEAGIRLTVTGSGMAAAAAAVGSVCTEYKAGQEDFLVNIGTAAGKARKGEVFLCNKILEQTTGRTFYPDLLYRHAFREAFVTTCAKPVLENEINEPGERVLYDMEAAAVYQAGAYFFGPHQMVFLKMVSDSGAAADVKPEGISSMLEAGIGETAAFISVLQAAGERQGRNKIPPEQADGFCLEKLCRDMHCSKAMSDSLRQYIRYAALSGIDHISVIRGLYQEAMLPCKEKREGKRCFEELKRRLF